MHEQQHNLYGCIGVLCMKRGAVYLVVVYSGRVVAQYMSYGPCIMCTSGGALCVGVVLQYSVPGDEW